MSGRPHRGTLRIRVAGAALGALLALAPLSCTSAEDEFCGRLGDTYQLDELVTSISGLDKPAITRHLTELRELQHEAPAEVHDDLRAVIDALVDVVRVVTDATGPDGATGPIDVEALNARLTAIQEPATRIVSYARTTCGLDVESATT